MTFDSAFEALTGRQPFPWQQRLYEDWFARGDVPDSCHLPTGLGKTSVIAIWLIALANGARVPRRLVYVVNRRTVVDQTTEEATKLRENAPKIGIQDLAISTLRGQFADNREWAADPCRPAIISGTVDMIGSRLLFSGYGLSLRTKPLHAGFLGQDALIVHDEAHLEPAFQELLIAIQKEQQHGRSKDFLPLRVMELSATRREQNGDGEHIRSFALTQEDHAHEVVKQRIRAKKELHLIPQSDSKVGVQIAKIAIERFRESGRAVLIFVRTIDDVKSVTDALGKAKQPFEQLIGPMRGWEREQLLTKEVFRRFLPDAPVADGQRTVYLVCTSAGEVGVNLSADHAVCDLSTFDSMAQRFGRVNRFGRRTDCEIHVVHPVEFDKTKDLERRRSRTLDLLRRLEGDASPAALMNLPQDVFAPDTLAEATFAPPPEILQTSDILFDAWALTSIRGRMPGRPLVEPYLHGKRDDEPPETQVAWRKEVAIVTGSLLDEYSPEEMLEEYPLKPHELLADRSDRVHNELVRLAARHPDVTVWIIDQSNQVTTQPLAMIASKEGRSRIEHRTIVLPDHIGGLNEHGLLDGSSERAELDVADEWKIENRPMRKRDTVAHGETPKPPPGMKPVYRIPLRRPDATEDEDAPPAEEWVWYVRVTQADADARSREPCKLEQHLTDAAEAAARFSQRLPEGSDERAAVVLAARFHDLGKAREQWQRMIGNARFPDEQWAKGTRWSRIERWTYRHEFGSVLDVRARPEFKALPADAQELALHLIAAHHGRARPHFTPEECLDDQYDSSTIEEHIALAARRFARLQRKYGRWGLAYLESLVRAADYAASQRAAGGEE